MVETEMNKNPRSRHFLKIKKYKCYVFYIKICILVSKIVEHVSIIYSQNYKN